MAVAELRGRLQRLTAFGLNTPDAPRLAEFFAAAFGAHSRSRRYLSGAHFAQCHPVHGGALCIELQLGTSVVELLQFDQPGLPYRDSLRPYDAEFQHFALIAADMSAAFERLSAVPGWTPLSRGGPQTLPANAGAVTAYKFRDPDGHPLELLSFPRSARPAAWRTSREEAILGIDHSAISSADVARSIAFYGACGLQLTAQTFNHGREQAALDGVPDPQVDVVALAPAASTPHVELLHYRGVVRAPDSVVRSHDIPATRLIFDAAVRDGTSGGLLRDPDGHYLEWRPAAAATE